MTTPVPDHPVHLHTLLARRALRDLQRLTRATGDYDIAYLFEDARSVAVNYDEALVDLIKSGEVDDLVRLTLAAGGDKPGMLDGLSAQGAFEEAGRRITPITTLPPQAAIDAIQGLQQDSEEIRFNALGYNALLGDSGSGQTSDRKRWTQSTMRADRTRLALDYVASINALVATEGLVELINSAMVDETVKSLLNNTRAVEDLKDLDGDDIEWPTFREAASQIEGLGAAIARVERGLFLSPPSASNAPLG